MVDPADVEGLARAREDVLERIGAAARRAGRRAEEVRLVAVTKTVPAERVAAAIAAGLDRIGENRVQEGAAKRATVSGGEWHLIGPLQSNKARRAVEAFDVIQTVDSVELARRIGRIAVDLGRAPLPVLVQVNVDADPAKAGFRPDDLAVALRELLDVQELRVEGLMTVGRLVEDAEAARPTFAALRTLSERLRARDRRLGEALSMGMTGDFEVAVEEGATLVRVGRALFGERPPAG